MQDAAEVTLAFAEERKQHEVEEQHARNLNLAPPLSSSLPPHRAAQRRSIGEATAVDGSQRASAPAPSSSSLFCLVDRGVRECLQRMSLPASVRGYRLLETPSDASSSHVDRKPDLPSSVLMLIHGGSGLQLALRSNSAGAFGLRLPTAPDSLQSSAAVWGGGSRAWMVAPDGHMHPAPNLTDARELISDWHHSSGGGGGDGSFGGSTAPSDELPEGSLHCFGNWRLRVGLHSVRSHVTLTLWNAKQTLTAGPSSELLIWLSADGSATCTTANGQNQLLAALCPAGFYPEPAPPPPPACTERTHYGSWDVAPAGTSSRLDPFDESRFEAELVEKRKAAWDVEVSSSVSQWIGLEAAAPTRQQAVVEEAGGQWKEQQQEQEQKGEEAMSAQWMGPTLLREHVTRRRHSEVQAYSVLPP